MEPEFKTILLWVVLIGGVMAAISATILFVAFRSFGAAKSRGGEMKPIVLIAGLLAFVIVCCILLLRFSAIR